uniref:Uncharacterized protein n=1 Tax=Meloidogyne enterolobii TaxID=390850 RepID=A0A6V7UE78_MELEN|nr:unnamed protein product [Meloidogyne enterolobii]
MHLKFALLFLNFVCITYVHSPSPQGSARVSNVPSNLIGNNKENDKIYVAKLAKKAEDVLSGSVQFVNYQNEDQLQNIDILLNYVKNLSHGNFGNIIDQLLKVKDAATALYQKFMKNDTDNEIETIKDEDFKNETYLNNILEKLLKSFKNNKIDGETKLIAILILKHFIFKFEIPPSNECINNKNNSERIPHIMSLKNTHKLEVNVLATVQHIHFI